MASILMSPIEHVWDALDRRIRQHVPVPANIQQLHTAIKKEWTNITQATTNNLINYMRRWCVALREENGVTPETDWFSDPPDPPPKTVKLHILEWPFIVASLRHTCAIIMLSNQHLDITPVRWMDYLGKREVLTNTDLDTIVNNIWEKWAFCVHRKSLRSLVQLMTNGGKNKSVAFIILVSVIKANVEPFASRADNKRCNKKV